MKLKDILDKVLDKTSSIEEICSGQFIEFHTCFCISDIPDDIEEPRLFLLMGSGESNTCLDINQEIQIKDNAVICMDTDDNELELIFHEWTTINLNNITNPN